MNFVKDQKTKFSHINLAISLFTCYNPFMTLREKLSVRKNLTQHIYEEKKNV